MTSTWSLDKAVTIRDIPPSRNEFCESRASDHRTTTELNTACCTYASKTLGGEAREQHGRRGSRALVIVQRSLAPCPGSVHGKMNGIKYIWGAQYSEFDGDGSTPIERDQECSRVVRSAISTRREFSASLRQSVWLSERHCE